MTSGSTAIRAQCNSTYTYDILSEQLYSFRFAQRRATTHIQPDAPGRCCVLFNMWTLLLSTASLGVPGTKHDSFFAVTCEYAAAWPESKSIHAQSRKCGHRTRRRRNGTTLRLKNVYSPCKKQPEKTQAKNVLDSASQHTHKHIDMHARDNVDGGCGLTNLIQWTSDQHTYAPHSHIQYTL